METLQVIMALKCHIYAHLNLLVTSHLTLNGWSTPYVDFKRMAATMIASAFCDPPAPFGLPETIKRAWQAFLAGEGADSLRAVEKCKQHPGKMWVVRGNRMVPLLPLTPPEQPWHSSQYQSLPEVYAQNASLEIAWTKVVFEGRTIAGNVLMPFFTKDYEGFDVNSAYDWNLAEHLIDSGQAGLPSISQSPYPLEEYAE